MSRTFSVKAGSVLMLKYPKTWGLRPKVLQIREMLAGDTPIRLDIEDVDHWGSKLGASSSKVILRISAIFSSSMLLGFPLLGASSRSSTP
ncbi:hypothetical protein AXFE_32890 [Acidithrix ferrooxidans]|uniref:Uncharacterized protein n=1 Tax=Acidithrix ferrooxidans TaxID=1280514 RepID=A0A0D8HD63_9ACTN|nr:hypothetical protein AXFE_32890 [Acidithrix ferrooxidans]